MYIATISNDNYTFTAKIDELINNTEPSILPEQFELEKGLTIQNIVNVEPPLFYEIFIEWLKSNDLYMQWMKSWTSGTIKSTM